MKNNGVCPNCSHGVSLTMKARFLFFKNQKCPKCGQACDVESNMMPYRVVGSLGMILGVTHLSLQRTDMMVCFVGLVMVVGAVVMALKNMKCVKKL